MGKTASSNSKALALAKQIAGYVIGYLLFYRPFLYFYAITSNFITETGRLTKHLPCATIPLGSILQGNLLSQTHTSLFALALLVLVSLFFGPLFCGKLCPSGGLAELLSHLLPDRFKIDWAKYVPVAPVRYGFFMAFLCSGLFGLRLGCGYCNFFALERMIDTVTGGQALAVTSSLFMVFVTTFIILGLFTKGGRGYCNFFCPLGAFSSIFHYLGKFVPGTRKYQVQQNKCIGCGKCSNVCPMRAAVVKDKKADIELTHCIACGQCQQACPVKAVIYGTKIKTIKY